MMDFLIGEHVSDEYLPLLLEELAFADTDPRAPDWNKDAILTPSGTCASSSSERACRASWRRTG